MQTDKSVSHLNSLLRAEISAVETYQQAIPKVTTSKNELVECERSHRQRVERLKGRILQLGGTPASGSGVWGSVAKLIEAGAKILGEKAAIAALEEGEDRGIKDYKGDMSDLDPDSKRLVEEELFPAQQKTHRAMSTLKHSLH